MSRDLENWQRWQRAWNLANPEKLKAKTARRKARNPTKYAEKARRASSEWRKLNPERSAAQRAARRCALQHRTPPWADLEEIAGMYAVASILSRGGVQFHVDHDYPLRGRLVSGLHVIENLRVIPAWMNREKINNISL